jgi:secondary thiamine-phosphate synthase enzyme
MIATRKITLDTNALDSEHCVSVINITPQVQKQAADVYIGNGIVTIFVAATTAGIATIEFEPGLVSDFQKMWSRIIPRNLIYEHKFLWEENNGFSHVRASFLGPSLVVPLVNKRLTLGQYQQVVFVEFDNRARSRQVILQFIGESGDW